jgi:EAL domain-containing protein (putative c-di-GMP-specific phosphodiesterase class I)
MDNPLEENVTTVFGQRKLRPRVVVWDDKQHTRKFLGDTLEELGFVTFECAQVTEFSAALDRHLPDLVVFGSSTTSVAICEMLNVLAIKKFPGNVLLLGQLDSSPVTDIQNVGEQHGLAMLPVLGTPFKNESLRETIATLLPRCTPPPPPVDVAEALAAGWLELWYQPQFDTHTLSLGGAEALIRMRHPNWGIVAPAYFIPDHSDPQLRGLSEFVIRQALEDWNYFLVRYGHLEIAINLPISFFQDSEAVAYLCDHMPDDPAFEGLTIEINGTEMLRDMQLLTEIAKQLHTYKIIFSLDDLGAEWPSLMEMTDFPFAEIKVDRKFIAGCAEERLNQKICRRIVQLADASGLRTVAEGVETRADFLAVREMNFDRVQGFLLGKPMTPKKFSRTTLSRPVSLPH